EHEGGVVEHIIHHVEIETSPLAIPDALHISVKNLHLNGTLTLGDIYDLPEGAKLITDPKTIAVTCHEPAAEVEEEAGAGAAEPEVIGRKAAEDEEAAEK